MKLPGGELAIALFGFTRDRWDELRQQLLYLARTGDAEFGQTIELGQMYDVRGMIDSPGGRRVMIQSAWIVLRGDDFPRFVTAIPGDRK